MASVVINVLKKKSRGNLPSELGAADGTQQRGRWLLWKRDDHGKKARQNGGIGAASGSSDALKSMSVEERAARTIQRTFRGHMMRQELKGLVAETEITNQSVVEVLEIMARWHVGWTKFVLQLLVGSFLIVTVYFQCFYYVPGAFEVNQSIIHRLDVEDLSKNVKDSESFFLFLEGVVSEFYEAHILNTTRCQTLLADYCGNPNSTGIDDILYERELAMNCSTASSQGPEYGYIDNVNRIFETPVVTQRRAQVVHCAPELNSIEQLAYSFKPNPRQCLGTSRTSRFQVDPCTEASPPNSSCELSSTRSTVPQYRYSPELEGFVFPLHAGGIQGVPLEALQCKIQRLKESQWLDYRAQEICFATGIFNQEAQGRMMAYKECFEFTLGGKVSNRRSVSSISLMTDPTAAMVLTWIMIALIVIKQFVEILLLLQERQAQIKRGVGRRKRWEVICSWENLLNFFTMALILAGCIMYLVLAYKVFDLRDNGKETATLSAMLKMLRGIDNAIRDWVTFTTIVACGLLVALGRTVLLLDFHPTSAIVSGTLRRASSGLGCFFLIFALVVLVYAFIGMILLGRSRLEFSGFGLAVNTLLFIAIGEVESIQDVIFKANVDEEYVTVIQALYLWSFILLVTILLMNVLLSIIVGAFVELQEKSEKQLESRPVHSFSRSLVTSIRFWIVGTGIVVKRSWLRRCAGHHRCRRCGCCCRESSARGSDLNNSIAAAKLSKKSPSALLTPWERLVRYPKHYVVPGTVSQPVSLVRARLERIFRSEQSVELIILWCRAHTRLDKMHRYGYHLRGLDPDSAAIKGRQVYLLESIMKRLAQTGDSNGPRINMTRSVLSATTKGSATHSNVPDDDQFDLDHMDNVEAVAGQSNEEGEIYVKAAMKGDGDDDEPLEEEGEKRIGVSKEEQKDDETIKQMKEDQSRS